MKTVAFCHRIVLFSNVSIIFDQKSSLARENADYGIFHQNCVELLQ